MLLRALAAPIPSLLTAHYVLLTTYYLLLTPSGGGNVHLDGDHLHGCPLPGAAAPPPHCLTVFIPLIDVRQYVRTCVDR